MSHPAGLLVGDQLVWRDHTGYGQPVFDFIVTDRMTANDRGPCFVHLVRAPAQDLGQNVQTELVIGKTDDIQCAVVGIAPIAKISLSELAAAIWPNT